MITFKELKDQLKQKKIEQVKKLIEKTPDLVNLEEAESKQTITFIAVYYLYDEIAAQLIEFFAKAGANINHEDVDNRTIAYVICARGMIKSLDTIMNINNRVLYHRDVLGQTPLFAAVRYNQHNFIKQIPIPQDLMKICDHIVGHTLIFYSVACGCDKMCKVLLKKGADPFGIDFCGQSIFDYISRTPSFEKRMNSYMRQFLEMQKREEAPKNDQKDEQSQKQAYYINIIKKSDIKLATQAEKDRFLQVHERLQQKQKNQAYLPSLEKHRDEHDQNWRYIAIKIIDRCIRHRTGRWFSHTSKAQKMFSPEQLKNLPQLMDLTIVNTKLHHQVYNGPRDFLAEMEKIWDNCMRYNSSDMRIITYADEFKRFFFNLWNQYNMNRFY